ALVVRRPLLWLLSTFVSGRDKVPAPATLRLHHRIELVAALLIARENAVAPRLLRFGKGLAHTVGKKAAPLEHLPQVRADGEHEIGDGRQAYQRRDRVQALESFELRRGPFPKTPRLPSQQERIQEAKHQYGNEGADHELTRNETSESIKEGRQHCRP